MSTFWPAVLTLEEGQTILFGVQSRFISRSERARLQVSSMCSGYDLCYPD